MSSGLKEYKPEITKPERPMNHGLFGFDRNLEIQFRALLCGMRRKERRETPVHRPDMKVAGQYSEEMAKFLEKVGYQLVPK